jgi:hypothetical protein
MARETLSLREIARDFVDAIRTGARQDAEERGPGRFRGEVTRWGGEDDFVIGLHGEDMDLDEDDVTLGQSVRTYHRDVGIDVGDTLILVEVGEADFVAVDVESDNDLPELGP